eukprot:c12637_g2_i5.p1 GENE.c12637_g2_i5~~c12637_g2_i5.p1  ORF type:complete len:375 (-),score=79.63 c12637_g2_i5:291-1361(-)
MLDRVLLVCTMCFIAIILPHVILLGHTKSLHANLRQTLATGKMDFSRLRSVPIPADTAFHSSSASSSSVSPSPTSSRTPSLSSSTSRTPSLSPSPSQTPSQLPSRRPMDSIEFVVINLEESKERMDSIRHQFDELGLADQLRRFGAKRVLSVGSDCVSRYSDFRYLTPSEMDQIRLPPEERIAGTVGTFLSHYTIWGEIAHSTSPSIVLEDDAKLTPRLTDALDFISRTDLEYLNLGAEGFGIDCYRNQVHNPVMFPFTGPSTTSYDIACVKQSAPHNCGNYGGGNIAYYLTPIGAQRLLDLYTQKLMFVPADWFIIRCAESQPLADCKWRSMVPGVVERVEKIKSDRLQMEACYV